MAHRRLCRELRALVQDRSLQDDALLLIDACLVGVEEQTKGKMFPFDLALHEAAQTSAQHPGWVNTRKALKKLLNAKAHQARPASQKNQAETAGEKKVSETDTNPKPLVLETKSFTKHFLPDRSTLRLKLEFVVKGPWRTLLEGYLLKFIVELGLDEYPFKSPTIRLVPFAYSLRQHDPAVRGRLRALYKTAFRKVADLNHEVSGDITKRARFVCENIGFRPEDCDFSDKLDDDDKLVEEAKTSAGKKENGGPIDNHYNEIFCQVNKMMPKALCKSHDIEESVLLEKLGMLHHPNVEKRTGKMCHCAEFYKDHSPASDLKHFVITMVAALVDPAIDPTSNASALADLLTDRTAYCAKFVGTLEAPGFAFPFGNLRELRFTRLLDLAVVQSLDMFGEKTHLNAGISEENGDSEGTFCSPLKRKTEWLAKYNDDIRRLRQENNTKKAKEPYAALSCLGSSKTTPAELPEEGARRKLPKSVELGQIPTGPSDIVAGDATDEGPVQEKNQESKEEDRLPEDFEDGDNSVAASARSNGTVSDLEWEVLEKPQRSSSPLAYGEPASEWEMLMGEPFFVEEGVVAPVVQQMYDNISCATVQECAEEKKADGEDIGEGAIIIGSPSAAATAIIDIGSQEPVPAAAATDDNKELQQCSSESLEEMLFECDRDFPNYGHEAILPATWSFYKDGTVERGEASVDMLSKTPSLVAVASEKEEEEHAQKKLPAHVTDFLKNGPPSLFFSKGTFPNSAMGTKAFLRAMHSSLKTKSVCTHRKLCDALVRRSQQASYAAAVQWCATSFSKGTQKGAVHNSLQDVGLALSPLRTTAEQLKWLSDLTEWGTREENSLLAREIKHSFITHLQDIDGQQVLAEREWEIEKREKKNVEKREKKNPCALVTRDVVVRVKALPEHLFDMEGMKISLRIVENVNSQYVHWEQLREDLSEDHVYERLVRGMWLPKDFRHDLYTATPRCELFSEIDPAALGPYIYRSMVVRHEEQTGGPLTLSCGTFPLYSEKFFGGNEDDSSGDEEKSSSINAGHARKECERAKLVRELGQKNDPYGGSGSFAQAMARIPPSQAPYPVFDDFLSSARVVTPPRTWAHTDKLSSLGEEDFFVHFPMVLFDAAAVDAGGVYRRASARLIMEVDYGFGEPLTGEIDLEATFSEHVRSFKSKTCVNKVPDVLLELAGAEAAEASIGGESLCHLVNFELTFGAERKL